MHRHGYKGRKLGRQCDQRLALLKSLAAGLIEHQTIETTLAKAKELVPFIEKLITKAKKGDLASRRQVIAALPTKKVAFKLVDNIAPQLKNRSSGYVRLERAGLRTGDGAQLATVAFVDELKDIPKKEVEA